MKSSVNQDLCKHCGLCIEVCPCNIIGQNQQGQTWFIPERQSICIHCGHCMAVCPDKAIVSEGLSYEKDFIDLPKNTPAYPEFMNLLSTRRSIRNFKNKAVPKEVIEEIINSIKFAPNGAAPEKTEITIVNNRKKIESVLPDIEKFLDDLVRWIENPIVSWMIKKKKGIETYHTVKNHLYPIAKSGNYNLSDGDRISRGAPALVIFHADKGAEEHTNNALIYATYFMLGAHSMGLGTSMNGIIPAAINKVKKIKDAFTIPTTHEAIISVIFGYPNIKYRRSIKREISPVHWVNNI